MRFKIKIILILILFLIFNLYGCNQEQKPIDNENDDETQQPVNENEDKTNDPIEEENPIETKENILQIEEWIINQYANLIVSENIDFQTTHPTLGGSIKWEFFDEDMLTKEGIYIAPFVDTNIDIMATIKIDDKTKIIFIPLIIKGNGTVYDVINQYIDNLLGTTISTNTSLPINHPKYNCVITWTSSNPDVFSVNGNFNKPEEDVSFELTYTIKYQNEEKTYTRIMTALGLTEMQKANKILTTFNSQYSNLGIVNNNITLDTTSDLYNSTITWESSNPGIISSTGLYRAPIYDQLIKLTVTIQVGEGTVKATYLVQTKGEISTNKWDQITTFLNSITKSDINTHKLFYLYGYEVGYEKVPTQNIGYLPFYDSTPMTIIQEIVPLTNTYIRPGRNRTATKYIVIHNTGMAAPTATAKNLSKSIQNSTRQASWHYSLDDYETYQQLGINEIGWHAGDSDGNNYGIGIESCVYQGVDFNVVLRRLAKLTAKLLIEYNLGFEDIKQHYDFSGKNCPQVIRESDRWAEFIDLVQIEYFGQTYLKDVTFEWTSLSKEYLDDTGKIIYHPKSEVVVSYQVKVTYNNETRFFVYNSNLKNI